MTNVSMTMTFSLLALAAVAGGKEPWRDPAVSAINRLPARAIAVPCETPLKAVQIAQGKMERTDSRWLLSLDGKWGFKWKHSVDAPDWEENGTIEVPGCWQLQGEFDPPLYTNMRYPIAGYETGDVMAEPPKGFTSHRFRNPVGLYTCRFTLPATWKDRRVTVHFGGVSSAMYVRLNGKDVGYSEDSRLPAEFDLTPLLAPGENTLEVEVLKHCDGTFLEDQDFWRLSGIFRSVWLVSELKDASRDLIVETELSDDLKTGHLTVRDENGKTLLEKTYDDVHLWDAGEPHLYFETIQYGEDDYRAVSVGFRKIEITNSVVTINGKRALFKGVNRHEMSPKTGYYVTADEMKRDLEIFEDLHINAVRTCHYPDDPTWYELCDRAGVYVVCEANVEAHGVKDFYRKDAPHLPKNPLYRDAIVQRQTNMVKTFRNHPSIVFWSLGNESGDGPAMSDGYRAVKALDSTRPVQYEGAQDSDHSDVKCPMYTRPRDCERYVKDRPAKPMILCEYAHAMGNSTGNFAEYWDLADKYPSFQGGFIWDFADQALWRRDALGMSLAYGGDFGDTPNDDNFNCNGIVDALREYHPGAYEVRHVYGGGRAREPESFEKLDLATYRPAVRELPPAEAAVATAFELVLWRAPTDNDRGWKMPEVCKVWKEATESQKLPEGVTSDLSAKRLSNGCIRVTWKLVVPEGKELPPLPRAGLAFTIPREYTRVKWYGYGPWENYSDRFYSAYLGEYTGVVSVSDGFANRNGAILHPEGALNPDNYSKPGEQGHRGGCRWVEFIDPVLNKCIRLTALNATFGFNAWPYSQKTLEKARHQYELRHEGAITVTVDAVQMGVGGDNSWGARPHAQYLPGPGAYELDFLVEGL